MKRRLYSQLIITALLLIGAVKPADSADLMKARLPWDKYKVLAERNLFLRNRTRPVKRSDPGKPRPPANPELDIVLTGIIQSGTEFIALIEDNGSGVTTEVRAGGKVAAGLLKDITLDYVEYEVKGNLRKIKLGMNLAGGESSRTSAPSSNDGTTGESTASSAESSGSKGISKGKESEILKRLRERRQKELGK